MNLQKLQNTQKLMLNTEEIARLLNIEKKSAQITASRYVKKGYLLRPKRDIYILPARLENASEEKLFEIANMLQTPSYVSLTTALSYYNISTQQQRNYVESIAVKRTKNFSVESFFFNFNIVKEKFYSGFERRGNYFIATPEKAVADSIYLTSLKKYNSDFEAIDFAKVNAEIIDKIIQSTNKAAKNLWEKLCRTYNL